MKKKVSILFSLLYLPIWVIAGSIEGIYINQSDSYRVREGAQAEYGTPYEILIVDNGDGTYYVDDLFGGWYHQRTGYGADYCMNGNVRIDENGIVTLIDSYVSGWGDSLEGLTGTYDASSSTFKISIDYYGMNFVQTWIKDNRVFSKDGINYIIDENNAIVKRGVYTGELIIPSQIEYNGNSYMVTSLDNAFDGCKSLSSVTLPNCISTFGNKEFWGCRELINVNIPNSLNVLDGAFRECTSLTKCTIPSTITSIGNFTFDGCTSLEYIEFETPSSLNFIGDYAFENCTALKSVLFPNSLTSIGELAFAFCDNITELNLSENLTTIGESSFVVCSSLKTLNIPKSILKIGKASFTECSGLESIKVEDGNTKYDSRNNCNAIIETHSNTLILGCKNTVIPKDLTKIGWCAFGGTINMDNIEIPSSVIDIEGLAFWRCTGLNRMTIGTNVEKIGNGAFQECSELHTIIAPPSVKAIETNAFRECPSIKDFYIYAQGIPTTDAEAFINSPIENATLHVPAELVDAYKNTIPWSGFGNIVALTDDDPKVTSIHSYSKDDISPVNTYTLDGKRVQTPQHGINIIRMSDGTTKKVLMK